MLTAQEQQIVEASRDNQYIAPVGRLMEKVLSGNRDWVAGEAAAATRGIDMGRAFAHVYGQIVLEVSLATGIQPSGLLEMVNVRVENLTKAVESGQYNIKKG